MFNHNMLQYYMKVEIKAAYVLTFLPKSEFFVIFQMEGYENEKAICLAADGGDVPVYRGV